MTDQMNEAAIPAPEGPAGLIETNYQIGQDNIQARIGPFGLDIHNPVFLISGLTIVAFVILTLAFQDGVGPVFGALRDWLTATFDWFFLAAANMFVAALPGSDRLALWARSGSAAAMRRPTTAIPAGSRCCSRPAWASA